MHCGIVSPYVGIYPLYLTADIWYKPIKLKTIHPCILLVYAGEYRCAAGFRAELTARSHHTAAHSVPLFTSSLLIYVLLIRLIAPALMWRSLWITDSYLQAIAPPLPSLSWLRVQ